MIIHDRMTIVMYIKQVVHSLLKARLDKAGYKINQVYSDLDLVYESVIRSLGFLT